MGASRSSVVFATLGLALAGGSAEATGPGPVVIRNTSPEPPALSWEEQRPIYSPRRVRHAGDGRARLVRELFDVHTAMEYEQAAVLAARLVELDPQSPASHYNYACVMGRLHRADAALDSLERAVRLGWTDLVHLALDPDLQVVRDSPRYAALVEGLRGAESPAAPTGPEWPRTVTELQHRLPALLARTGAHGATIVLLDRGRPVWHGFAGAGPAGQGIIEAEEIVPLLALGAIAGHGGSPPAHPGPRTILAGGPDVEVRRTAAVEAVEAVTREPFLASCRRHLVEALELSETRLAAVRVDGVTRIVARSSAADLSTLLASLSSPRLDGTPDPQVADRIVGLARRLGVTVRSRAGRPCLEVAGLADPALALRWYPHTGQGVVVVTRGPDAEVAQAVAGLALGER